MDEFGPCGSGNNATPSLLTVDSVVRSVTRVLLSTPNPFAIQHNDQLLILDIEGGQWRFAEMRFHSVECGYAQVRHVHYDSPREAIGALLSRALAQGENALLDTVEHLHTYLMRHYQIPILNC
ncbi:MAG TPA: hypothetical protein PK819_13635 [Thermomicrobiales bacterium]|nr:hypothetical protein [Thermomicrobiales bacterium]